jgi:nitrate reductase gamma subunit
MDAKEMMERHPLEWKYLNESPKKKEKRRVRKEFLLIFLIVFLAGHIPSLSFARGLTDEEIMEAEKKLCWKCHRQPNLNSNEGIMTSILLCMRCHGKKDIEKKVDERPVSLYIDEKEYGETVHRRIACIRCHEGVATSPHRTSLIECASCHGYHGEGTAHDPHRRVNCEACHHESKEVRKDPKTGRIVLRMVKDGIPLKMTSHRLADFRDKKTCEKCHFTNNQLGAPIRALPAKSLICIGCHSSSVTLNDPVSMVSLILFIIGIGATLTFWFQGTMVGPSFSTHEKISYLGEKAWQIVFSKKMLILLKVFVVDVLLLRRILKESVSRWTIHSLIYLPFLLRFLIGLILLLLSVAFPMSPQVAGLLDKNNSFIAFTYDFLGLCIIIGIISAIMRRIQGKTLKVVTGGQDYVVLGLIGAILLTGFLLEGMRILLTALPLSAALPSFIGYPISLFLGLFSVRWEFVYPYGWYVHSILTGALVAYLPFSKMFHILVSPLVLLIKAAAEEK